MFYKKIFISYILIIVIPLIIVATMTSYIITKYINESVMSATIQTLNQANSTLSNIFDNAKNTLLYFSMNKEVQNNLSRNKIETPFEINKEIAIIRNSILYPGIFNNNYSSVEIFALNKQQYPTLFEQNDVMSSTLVSSKNWYIKTLQLKGIPYWFLNSDFDHKLISVSRLVFSLKDFTKPIAIITIDIDMSKIDSILSNIHLGETGSVYLIDKNGNKIYSSEKTPYHINFSSLYNNTSGKNIINIDKNKVMVIYNTLPQNNWKLVGIVSIAELNKKANIIRSFIYFIAFLSLLIASLISLYFSLSISKPIIELANQMKKIENGDFNLHIEGKWKGEINILYSSFNYMIKKINELIEQIYLSKIREKDSELKALQAQINPHFLYNTLDSVNWLAIQHNIPEISKIIISLSSILRYSISKENSIATLEDEIKHITSYINIQKFRFKDKFSVNFLIDTNILNSKIIKLILQPIVENAIIHGIETYLGKGEILINGFLDENNIVFYILNNGNLVDLNLVNKLLNSPTEEKESYGIQNVNERIKLYYGEKYGLSYQIYKTYTVAKIIIPKI